MAATARAMKRTTTTAGSRIIEHSSNAIANEARIRSGPAPRA